MSDDKRQAFIDGLRALANFYEAHPTLREPFEPHILLAPLGQHETQEAAAAMARLLTPCEKEWSDSLLTLSRTFGALELRVVYWRHTVCERVVTGQREVPEQVIPAHTEEIAEWKCAPSLLGTSHAG